MKKLLVMVMAMALVFGMSAGVMAELGDESVPVKINMLQNALVDIEADNLELDIVPPASAEEGDYWSDDHYQHKVDSPISIKSNGNFNVLIEQDLSVEFREYLDSFSSVVLGDYSEWGAGDTGAFVYVNAELENGDDYGSEEFPFDNGPQYRLNNVDAGVLEDTLIFNVNIGDWDSQDGYNWTDLEADEDFNGNVTVTVEAN